jgi:hypothetical protein
VWAPRGSERKRRGNGPLTLGPGKGCGLKGKRVTGWLNGSGPVRNEKDFHFLFPLFQWQRKRNNSGGNS